MDHKNRIKWYKKDKNLSKIGGLWPWAILFWATYGDENVDLEEKKISEYFLNKEKLKKISKKGNKEEEEKNYKERRYV